MADDDADRAAAKKRSAGRKPRFLPGLQPRVNMAKLSGTSPLLAAPSMPDQGATAPPAQIRIPVRQVGETKVALHKLMQTVQECLVVLDNAKAIGGDQVALGAVRYRLRLIAQEIAKVMRIRV